MLKYHCPEFWRIPLALSTVSLTCCFTYPLSAQIIPDNSLGNENSIVTVQDNLADLIEGGAIRVNNLFHSFSEFNVSNGAKVYFANPNGIANILIRTTGNNISEIFGTLGVDGAANLFLLNPNGIVFGENAALDINGSFFATTADSFVFDNGFEYSGSNPNFPPLLTINSPVGVQFGNQTEAIVNRSIALNEVEETVGLEVSPEENITLVGGKILVEGGFITAPNGNIQIGSVTPNSNVKIIPTENNWNLDYTEVNSWQDISLTQSASINSSGDGAGNINIQANKLSVLESSTIVANNLGKIDGGNLTINASESVEVNGTNDDLNSSITAEIYDTGKGANLSINTGSLQVTDGGYVSANNYGIGDGGDLTIQADESITVGGKDQKYSYISTDVYDIGNGGNLTIQTGTLKVKDQGIVSSTVWIPDDVLDLGNGGNITIKASDSVEVIGINSDGFDNVIGTGVLLLNYISLEELNLNPNQNSPNGGNLTIETGSLQVVNGGIVTTDNFGAGKGGSLTINASELVEVQGNSAEAIQSFISTSVYGTADGGDFTINTGTLRIVDDAYVDSITYAVGNGGTLTINANQVIVKDGGQLAVGITEGKGNAGNLIVKANDFVEISGGTRLLYGVEEGEVFFVNSSLFASANTPFFGNGGKIVIETSTLRLFDGGTITTETGGAGNGGNIFIRANNIEIADLIQDSYDRTSGINSLVSKRGTGNGGSIDIVTENLQVFDGGLISVDALGKGNAGNIQIQAKKIDISGISSGEPVFGVPQEQLPSSISAFSQGDFQAGSITINSNSLNLRDNADISVSNLGNGNSGNLNITANELNLDNSATIEAKVNAGNQGNINLTTDNIFLRNNSEINAKATGAATGGNITINNTDNIVLLESSKILADAIEGNGGNVNITTQGLFVSPDSLISASSEFGLDGNVNIEIINGDRHLEFSPLPENIQDSANLITVSCSANDNNAFAISGNGGIPNSPYSTQSLTTTWYDLRPVSHNQDIVGYISPVLEEANTTIINSEGEIELIALTPLSSYRWVKSSCEIPE